MWKSCVLHPGVRLQVTWRRAIFLGNFINYLPSCRLCAQGAVTVFGEGLFPAAAYGS